MSRSSRSAGNADGLAALIAGALARRPRQLARAISLLESGDPRRRTVIDQIYERTGGARVVGITGPPGAGKSTLVDRLARRKRQDGCTVAILAVDPTSPFSGGALLGDRVRMQGLYTDPDVFIRSMATRGAMGGLATATRDVVDLLDAAGFDWILIETVGVGQDEVDVVRTVDSVVVVTVPGLGDEIQAIKAGIMEIADAFVINKADRPGADGAQRDLESMLSMAAELRWRPSIVQTVASEGRGVDDLLEAIDEHWRWLGESGALADRRFQQLRLRVENNLKERILAATRRAVAVERELKEAFERGENPYSIADRLFALAIQPQPASAADLGDQS